MKKPLWAILVLMLVCVLALSACDKGTDQPQNPDTEQSTNQPLDNNDESTDTDNTQPPFTNNTECQHTFGDWETAKQATCNEEGELVRTCSKCSHSEITTIAKNNVHIEVIDNAVLATCTEDGKTEGKHCSRCNETLVAQTTVGALGHIEVIDSAVAATCTTDGKTEGKHCSRCNIVLVSQTNISAVDHDYESGACTMCKSIDTVAKQAEIDAENIRHQDELDSIDSFYSSTISALEQQIDNLKWAYDISYTYETSYCRTLISNLTSEIAQLERRISSLSGSSYSADIAEKRKLEAQVREKDAEREVYYKHITINNCYEQIDIYESDYQYRIKDENATHKANLEAIEIKYTCASNGHTVVVDKAISSTCAMSGRKEGSHCSLCGMILVEQEIIKKLPHTPINDSAIPPTCSTTGLGEGSHCFVCNETIVAQEIISKLPHTPITDVAIAPTCISTGLSEGSHCSVCNEVIVQQMILMTTSHTNEIDQAVPPTCTTTGLTEGTHCSVCNKVLKPQTVLAANGHSTGNWIIDKEATKTENGARHKFCTVCQTDVCQEIIYAGSKGLAYTITNGGTTCRITGIGTCTDKDIIIPQGIDSYPVTAIGDNAFYGCKGVTSITIPDGVVWIGYQAFSYCSLKNITIPNGVTGISSRAFYGCSNLTSVILPDSVTAIGSLAFRDCRSLTEITIPGSVTEIGELLFAYCTSLTNVNILEGVTSIGNDAFWFCTGLTNIIIPNSISSIGKNAFSDCDNLKNIHFSGTTNQWCDIEKDSHCNSYTGNYTVYCADGTVSKNGTITYS